MYNLLGWIFTIIAWLAYFNAISFQHDRITLIIACFTIGAICFIKADIQDLYRKLEIQQQVREDEQARKHNP